MESEDRIDYIVLDNINSSWDGTAWASWEVPDYMFKQYEKDDEIFISLHNCDYWSSVATPSTYNTYVLIDNVQVKNQENTNRQNILSIRENNIIFRDSNYYISPKNSNTNDIMINVGKFYKIKLAVRHEGNYIDINSETSESSFILKVSYKKKN
jgi:hypothetical protein